MIHMPLYSRRQNSGWMSAVLCIGLLTHWLAGTGFADATNPLDVTQTPPARQAMYDGMVAAQDGNYEAAVPKLEWAIERDPTLLGAWETLGWSYWHLDRKSDSAALWERLRVLAPDEPQVYQWLAALATENLELAEAASLLQQSLSIDPDQFEIRLDLGRVQLWRGRLGDAIRAFRLLLDQDPDRLDVVLELARALQYAWQFDQALPLWEQLLAVAPDIIEYRLGRALSLLHTGNRAEAVRVARGVLEETPDHVLALTLLADDAEYSDQPAGAIRYLERAIAVSDEPDQRDLLRQRLVTLLLRLRQDEPLRYPIERPIALTRERARENPMNLDAQLLLGELLLMNRRFEDAAEIFHRVRREFNPENLRALRGLYEIALARFEFDDARGYLERIRTFNPADPYLLADEAMFHSRRGDFKRAHEALDALERRGGQGAVAGLLYHTLSPSDIGPALPVRLFREHLEALMDAGYQILSTDELGDYLDRVSGMPDDVAGIAPTRAVVVTFDDALEYAMTLATPVARELGIVLVQFIPSGAVSREDPLTASWPRLREFLATGHWHYGSLLHDAQEVVQVRRTGPIRPPVSNRLRDPDSGQRETLEDFDRRLRGEYERSRQTIESETGRTIESVAYPFGDLGQEGAANVPDAIRVNLAQAERYYALGFTVRSQGHAVAGDNPLLYGRYEPPPWATGEAVVSHLLSQHPVLLAQRLRLEFATFQGRRQLARDTLAQMRRSGYPETEIERLSSFIKARLARKFDLPLEVDDISKAPWSLELKKPYLGLTGHYFTDRLKSENRHVTGEGGLHVTPHLTLEARYAAGEFVQPDFGPAFLTADLQDRPDVSVRERSPGMSAAFLLPRRTALTLAVDRRNFAGDADWQLWRYGGTLNIRPLQPLDVKLAFEHDAVNGARVLRRELTHDLWSMHGVWTFNDRWDLWGSGRRYDFSDGNRRTHWHLLPMALVWRDPGLVAGLRYAEDDARRLDVDYWTPYRQQGIHLEAGFRGNWRRHYYNLIGRVGQARERVRPEVQRDYDALVSLYEGLLEQARRQRWGRRAIAALEADIDALQDDRPVSRWETVYGISGSCILRFGAHWEVEGLISHEESPRYHETHLGAGVRYRF